jgi:hypothetical protein
LKLLLLVYAFFWNWLVEGLMPSSQLFCKPRGNGGSEKGRKGGREKVMGQKKILDLNE